LFAAGLGRKNLRDARAENQQGGKTMNYASLVIGLFIGTCGGFLLASLFKVGGGDDSQPANNGAGIRLCGPPEKMLKNNVKAMDRGIED
jgi:hypothetical protein